MHESYSRMKWRRSFISLKYPIVLVLTVNPLGGSQQHLKLTKFYCALYQRFTKGKETKAGKDVLEVIDNLGDILDSVLISDRIKSTVVRLRVILRFGLLLFYRNRVREHTAIVLIPFFCAEFISTCGKNDIFQIWNLFPYLNFLFPLHDQPRFSKHFLFSKQGHKEHQYDLRYSNDDNGSEILRSQFSTLCYNLASTTHGSYKWKSQLEKPHWNEKRTALKCELYIPEQNEVWLIVYYSTFFGTRHNLHEKWEGYGDITGIAIEDYWMPKYPIYCKVCARLQNDEYTKVRELMESQVI